MKLSTIFSLAPEHLRSPGAPWTPHSSEFSCHALRHATGFFSFPDAREVLRLAVEAGAHCDHVSGLPADTAYLARLMFLDLMARALREEGK